MASASQSRFLLLLLLLLLLHVLSFLSLAHTLRAQFVIPVARNPTTLQYLAQIYHGDALLPTNLVLDLNGPLLWVSRASPPTRPVPRRSIQCLLATRPIDGGGSGYSCGVLSRNGVTGMASLGQLAEDILAVDSADVFPSPAVSGFLFSFSPESLLSGLASGANGMLGLGKSRIALPEQIAAASGDRRFFLCLSSSNGVVVAGGDPPYASPLSPLWAEISKSLTYTPLLASETGDSSEYLIDLKSIKVNGERVALDASSSMKMLLSTVVPYTTMDTSIYTTFIEAYARAAAAANLTRAPAVARFELCFSSQGLETTATGPAVPSIDLVLQSEMVRWRIQGRNSMVRVSEEIMCLGFVDGGGWRTNQKTAAIVLGGHQLEDVLLGFDLGASMVGFSNSLRMGQRSCSEFYDLHSLQKNHPL